jgi:YebC/PmpR family DNA-binding regulatory protein
MSGHSKWSTIKRKKAKVDAQRGKIFTKLIKEITVAAREGGGDPEANPRLRTAIDAAKAANMPMANIERAIKRGTGELPGVSYEEAIYEAYGPGGVALLIEVLTDNKKRTVAEVRHLVTKHHGSMGEAGSVSWQFERKGLIQVPVEGTDEEEVLMIAIDAGAEDLRRDNDYYEITTAPDQLEQVRQALQENGVPLESATLTMYPTTTIKVEGKEAEQLLRLLDALEEHDDVQNVYSNFDIDVELLETLES